MKTELSEQNKEQKMRVKKRELTLESLVLEIFVWNEEEERGFAAQQSKKECLYVIP